MAINPSELVLSSQASEPALNAQEIVLKHFSCTLEEIVPRLFASVETEFFDKALEEHIFSFLVSLDSKRKMPEEPKEGDKTEKKETAEINDYFKDYYKKEFLKTKESGEELTLEENERICRYSEYFSLYLASEYIADQRSSGHFDLLQVLKSFLFSKMEDFCQAPKEMSGFGSMNRFAYGPSEKHEVLKAFYSKGISHEQLISLIQYNERGYLHQLPYYFAIEEIVCSAEYDRETICFLLDIPSAYQIAKFEKQLDYNMGNNSVHSEHLKMIVELLQKKAVSLEELRKYATTLDIEKIEPLLAGESFKSIQKEIEELDKYSLYQQRLIIQNQLVLSQIKSLTDEQAFVVFTCLRKKPALVTKKTLAGVKKINFIFDRVVIDGPYGGKAKVYDFDSSEWLMHCLYKGVPPEFFDRPGLNYEERVEETYKGLQKGLTVEQVQHPSFSSHGLTVLKILSEHPTVSVDECLRLPKKLLKALEAGIPKEIYEDKAFHEMHIECLKEGFKWEELKRISLEKLCFLSMKRHSNAKMDSFPIELVVRQTKRVIQQDKLSQFYMPIEMVHALSYAQLSFIYWEGFRFAQSPTEEHSYYQSDFFERYQIAKQCTDFDIECICRLNITLDTLRENPHLRVEHIQAYEEGFSKERVLSCKEVKDLEELRCSLGRPKPQVLESELFNAFEQAWLKEKRLSVRGTQQEDRKVRAEALGVSSSASLMLTQFSHSSISGDKANKQKTQGKKKKGKKKRKRCKFASQN